MSNFEFLKAHSSAVAALGATAEKIFPHDPVSCVAKLRLLAEALAKDVGHRLGIQLLQPTQAELLRAIDSRLGLELQVQTWAQSSATRQRLSLCCQPPAQKTISQFQESLWMSGLLSAKEHPLFKIFCNNVHFSIPNYQRPYS